MSVKEKIDESFKDILAKAKEKKANKNNKDKDKENDDSENDSDDNKDEKEVKDKDKKDVKESTDAANSLHPAAKSISDPMSLSSSKLGMMNHTMGLMNGMNKNDMVTFFDKVINQFGPSKDHGVSDNSSKNQNTLDMHNSHAVSTSAPKTREPMPKLAVKEDLNAMFEGQELSEEFKENATTLFEAAISARIIAETARIEKEYEEHLAEELVLFQEELSTKLDSYLDYVIETWMKENEVAIESTLKSEITTDFIDGMRNLFAEHYVEVPDERSNVMEQLADKVSELEKRLSDVLEENTSYRESILGNQVKEAIEEVSSDLSVSQQEKFASFAEGIDFNGDLDSFTRKLNVIKENHFKPKEIKETNINEEVFDGVVGDGVKNSSPYAQWLNRFGNV